MGIFETNDTKCILLAPTDTGMKWLPWFPGPWSSQGEKEWQQMQHLGGELRLSDKRLGLSSALLLPTECPRRSEASEDNIHRLYQRDFGACLAGSALAWQTSRPTRTGIMSLGCVQSLPTGTTILQMRISTPAGGRLSGQGQRSHYCAVGSYYTLYTKAQKVKSLS